MTFAEEKIALIYDKAAKYTAFYELDALFGKVRENSIYRRRTIATLNINQNYKVLDVACGIGLNFKIIESYLKNTGLLVGIDISKESLKVANSKVKKYNWKNVKLINDDIVNYDFNFNFDVILCTLALTIIPKYKETIDKIYSLLKPKGRFAILDMKLPSGFIFKPINPMIKQFYYNTGIKIDRDLKSYVQSKFDKIIYYEECFYGNYYIITALKL